MVRKMIQIGGENGNGRLTCAETSQEVISGIAEGKAKPAGPKGQVLRRRVPPRGIAGRRKLRCLRNRPSPFWELRPLCPSAGRLPSLGQNRCGSRRNLSPKRNLYRNPLHRRRRGRRGGAGCRRL